MNRRTLIERWTTEDGKARADEIVASLIAGRPLDNLGVGEHEGRLDLRCLPTPPIKRLQRFEANGWFVEKLGSLVKIRHARLEHVDLTGAQLSSLRFFHSVIEDCRFDTAMCRDWRMWGTQVVNCSFRKVNLAEAVVGGWHENRQNLWSGSDFTGSDLRGLVSKDAIFEHCDFSGAKLDQARFEQCRLTNLRFAGNVRQVVFDGRGLADHPAPPPMEGIDFRDATFREVEFMGCTLDSVQLPLDPDVRRIRKARCTAQRALELLGVDDSVQAQMLRAILENRLLGPGTDDEDYLFNRWDYLHIGGEELLALAEVMLTQAELDCIEDSRE